MNTHSRILIIIIALLVGGAGYGIYRYLSVNSLQVEKSRCLIYGVYEKKISEAAREENTGFFSIDPKTKSIREVGNLHKDKEYQGIERDPVSGQIYTNTSNNGVLQILDPISGNLREVGSIPFIKINSFAYHPKDGSLWAWPEEEGIIKINPESADATMQFESKLEIESMAWNDEGNLLYGASEESSDLYSYDPALNTLKQVSDNILEHTSGMTTVTGGLLLGATFDDDSHILTLYLYDPAAKTITSSLDLETSYSSVEGITWPIECGIPF